MLLQTDQKKADPELLSGGGFGSLSERLSKMRHDINNRLGVLSAATQIMQMKPDPATAANCLPKIAAQPQMIQTLVKEFSTSFERQAALIDQMSLVLPRLMPNSAEYHSVREVLTAQYSEIQRLEGQLTLARSSALQAAFADVLNEETLRSLARDVAEIEIELTVLRARALARITPTLTAVQKQRLLTATTG